MNVPVLVLERIARRARDERHVYLRRCPFKPHQVLDQVTRVMKERGWRYEYEPVYYPWDPATRPEHRFATEAYVDPAAEVAKALGIKWAKRHRCVLSFLDGVVLAFGDRRYYPKRLHKRVRMPTSVVIQYRCDTFSANRPSLYVPAEWGHRTVPIYAVFGYLWVLGFWPRVQQYMQDTLSIATLEQRQLFLETFWQVITTNGRVRRRMLVNHGDHTLEVVYNLIYAKLIAAEEQG